MVKPTHIERGPWFDSPLGFERLRVVAKHYEDGECVIKFESDMPPIHFNPIPESERGHGVKTFKCSI